ncbi:MAG TPA: hypothetical protein VGK24_01690 [Candidatus Angelobacter sp.]|jgi:hypothetical protein
MARGLHQRALYFGDKMKATLIVFMLFVYAASVTAQNVRSNFLGEIKQWNLHTQHSEVTIKLSGAPNGSDFRALLSLSPEGNAAPTVREEENLLRQVLNDMTELHYDPSKLEMISTWLQNSEFQEGVEHAVSESRKWKSCLGRKYCHQGEVAANHFLSSVDAFKDFDAVLHKYGLKRKAVRVDDMAVGIKAGRILCQGLVVISLGKEK